ncbi:MAG: tRNA pseudouridine(13) synthase TruD [Bacteroidota bacterium]
MDKIILKYRPEEFAVHENISMQFNKDGNYAYYNLYKIGYSTFDAVSIISEYFDLPAESIRYAGLKDEDGCTQQSFSVVDLLDEKRLTHFNQANQNQEALMKITFLGRGSTSLRIGGLNGNGFLVTVRNISSELNHIQKSSITSLYLNYYGEQRFGLPKEKKLTHLIGEALIHNNFDKALNLVKQSGAMESKSAKLFVGNSKDFFKSIDSRLFLFYLSAYSSFQWNMDLSKLLTSLSKPKDLHHSHEEGIPYVYAKKKKQLVKLMMKNEKLEYKRYSVGEDLSIEEKIGFRPTVLQTNIRVQDIEEDENSKGKFKFKMSFFLFKGSYATTMLRQFIELNRIADDKLYTTNKVAL